jgi:hypothetical protein
MKVLTALEVNKYASSGPKSEHWSKEISRQGILYGRVTAMENTVLD